MKNYARGINIKDIREGLFFIARMEDEGLELRNDANLTTLSSMTESIKDTFSYQCKSDKQYADIHKKIRNSIEKSLIPFKYFEWIKNNDMACFHVWLFILDEYSYIKTIRYDRNWINPSRLINSHEPTKEGKLQAIIEFFDCSRTSVNEKLKLLSYLKNRWSTDWYLNTSIDWVDKSDHIQCEWIWRMLLKYSAVSKDKIITNHYEVYMLIRALFGVQANKRVTIFTDDSIGIKSMTVRDIFTLIHKSWMQKKYRDKQKIKTKSEISLSKEVKLKLKYIAKKTGWHPDKIIEELILKRATEIVSPDCKS